MYPVCVCVSVWGLLLPWILVSFLVCYCSFLPRVVYSSKTHTHVRTRTYINTTHVRETKLNKKKNSRANVRPIGNKLKTPRPRHFEMTSGRGDIRSRPYREWTRIPLPLLAAVDLNHTHSLVWFHRTTTVDIYIRKTDNHLQSFTRWRRHATVVVFFCFCFCFFIRGWRNIF